MKIRLAVILLVLLGAGASLFVGAQQQNFPPGGSGGSFSTLTAGTSTTGPFVCGAGCSFTTTGGGTIAATPGGATTNVQFNNAGVLGGSLDLSWTGTVFKVGNGSGGGGVANPSMTINGSGGQGNLTVGQSGGSTNTNIILGGANGTVTMTASNANPAIFTVTGGSNAPLYQTATNCSVNSVSPAACSAAAAGSFVVPTTTTAYTVNTTAIKAASRVFLFPHTDTRDLPGAPTCVVPVITAAPTVSAIVASTSFSIAISSTTGQTCWDYWIVN